MVLPCGKYSVSYDKDMAVIQTKLQWGLLIAFLAWLFTFPLYVTDYLLYILITMGIILISVLGLNLLTGYCGQISIGQTAFMAVGAYTSSILCSKIGLSFWVALPLAGLSAGIVGLIFGAPSVRVKGFYLAMATLAAHFIIIYAIMHLGSLTGGSTGMEAVSPKIGGLVLDGDKKYFYLIMGMVVLMTFIAKNLVRSKVGRVFIAIRDNDLAAEVMGINIFRYKLLAFFIGCFYAGIAGSLYAHYLTFITSEHFTLMDSIWQLGMIIVGGLGSIMGAIFGTIFIIGLKEATIALGPFLSKFPIFYGGGFGPLGSMLFGLIIMLFLIFEPRGINHRWEILKSYYQRWPFSY